MKLQRGDADEKRNKNGPLSAFWQLARILYSWRVATTQPVTHRTGQNHVTAN